MIKKYIPPHSLLLSFKDYMSELDLDKSIRTILLLGGAKTEFKKSDYDPILQSSQKTIIGGIFPQVIFEENCLEKGLIVVAMKSDYKALIIEGSNTLSQVQSNLETAFGGSHVTNKSFLIFIDCLINNKEIITDSLFDLFGSLPNYIGGGTGSLDFKPFPNVFSNTGIIANACIVGMTDLNHSIGFAHGWQPISRPLKITSSEGNIIKTIEAEPAMDIYKTIVEKHSKKAFNHADFFETTKCYPFGIARLGSEMIVRDPFMEKDGSIYTLDNVEEGSFVKVLYAGMKNLLRGAKKAHDSAYTNAKNPNNEELIIFDCISRALFMGNSFGKEMNIINPNNKGFGALTLGEIANTGDSFLELYNKTTVVSYLNE